MVWCGSTFVVAHVLEAILQHYLSIFKHLALMISLRLCTKSVWNNKLNSDPLGPMFHLYPFHPKFLSFFFLWGGEFKTGIIRIIETPRNDTSDSPALTGQELKLSALTSLSLLFHLLCLQSILKSLLNNMLLTEHP